MNRNIDAIRRNNDADVIVIGCGIYGAALACQLTRAGYRVVAVEKGDFCSATSANSLKILHGGLRYLQHVDLRRMRESIRSRRDLMGFSPHLVEPLPCVMPTSGHGIRGREVLTAALLLNDLISADRNRGLPGDKRLGRGRTFGRKTLREILPALEDPSLTGGCLWHDGLALNTERIVLEHLLEASKHGAAVLNYVRADRIRIRDGRVTGVELTDLESGVSFDVSARWVINAAGPWFGRILESSGISAPRTHWAKAVNLVIDRSVHDRYAVGLESREEYVDQDALIRRGKRLYLFVPWRGCCMVGTTYRLYEEDPDRLAVERSDVDEILAEANAIYPGLQARPGDVRFFHCGLVPIVEPRRESVSEVQLAKHSRIIDHRRHDGIRGLISLVTIKYTTAPATARQVLRMLGRPPLPRPGDCWENAALRVARDPRDRLPLSDGEIIDHLASRYGRRASAAAEYLVRTPDGARRLGGKPELFAGEVSYFVREEMARTLADVVFRRTGLGTAGRPERAVLEAVADRMAHELSWTPERRSREIDAVESAYVPRGT